MQTFRCVQRSRPLFMVFIFNLVVMKGRNPKLMQSELHGTWYAYVSSKQSSGLD